ncbi:ABC transporter ATP-binding protein [Arthrobacter sp. H14]|uniref:ABC transporter ATP-binding protein n=1 Tax=Arthrobacter sp. H14 TaxID=1312959 RepID=UPI00047D72D2|nr:ABC transporter ATP-binding protein [Arthrobacter sp. H14]
MLELDSVGFGYARRRSSEWVFRNVSFHVSPGSATAVLGPNGSGKTTLVRCAAGLLNVREGEVHRADTVGYVPQAHGSSFAYKSLDMVLMGRARQVGMFRSPGQEDHSAAAEAMARVGISGLQDRLFPTLSGGEQQLVLIARAIAAGSPILVLDEPATGLDLKNQMRVLTLLRELMAGGMALLLSTHHPDHALYLADHVVLMGGQQVQSGTKDQLMTDKTLSALYSLPVNTIAYRDGNGVPQRTIVTGYNETPSPEPAGHPTA